MVQPMEIMVEALSLQVLHRLVKLHWVVVVELRMVLEQIIHVL
jgi:hypothetical protein